MATLSFIEKYQLFPLPWIDVPDVWEHNSKGTACIKAGPSYDWTSYPPLTTKVPFVRFDPAVLTLPGHKAQTEDSHIS